MPAEHAAAELFEALSAQVEGPSDKVGTGDIDQALKCQGGLGGVVGLAVVLLKIVQDRDDDDGQAQAPQEKADQGQESAHTFPLPLEAASFEIISEILRNGNLHQLPATGTGIDR